jgi:hypothetical protein
MTPVSQFIYTYEVRNWELLQRATISLIYNIIQGITRELLAVLIVLRN